jgi:hypothetical protein
MIGLLCFVMAVLASPFKSKLRLEVENAVLRHAVDCLEACGQHLFRDREDIAAAFHWYTNVLGISITARRLF